MVANIRKSMSPGGEHRADLGQSLTHRAGIPQPACGQRLADPQRGGHLGGHRRLGVGGPLLGV
jgi:hypothetical protein